MENIFEINGKKYKYIEQPSDSYEENPCWDCCFGNNGECNAPIEIFNSDNECGFSWSSVQFIYKEINE